MFQRLFERFCKRFIDMRMAEEERQIATDVTPLLKLGINPNRITLIRRADTLEYIGIALDGVLVGREGR